MIGRRDIPTDKHVRTTTTRLDAAFKEEEALSEWPNNPGDMIIYRHRDAIKRRRARGWHREEVKKVCNTKGENFGKRLCIDEKNQLLNKYYFLKQRVALIEHEKKRRNKGGIFAKTKDVKNPCSVKHIVE